MLTDNFGTEDKTMNMAEATAYESGVLVPDVHARLVQNIDSIASAAHIPKHMIWTSTKGICSTEEINYLRQYRRQGSLGNYGLVLTGEVKADKAHLRMMAMAGMCLRNMINAKVLTAQEIFTALKQDDPLTTSAIFVPNFHVTGEEGTLPEWQKQQLLNFLLCRFGDQKQTFLYVKDFDTMREDYGDVIAGHLESNFIAIEE